MSQASALTQHGISSPGQHEPVLKTQKERWQDWFTKRRPATEYLAIQCEEERGDLLSTLERAQTDSKIGETAATVIVVLDGSPEHSNAIGELHHFNGNHNAVSLIEEKDRPFVEWCSDTLEFFGGKSLFGKAPTRKFQDGCAVVFSAAKGVTAALSGLLFLKELLANMNMKNCLPWNKQWHYRCVVGNDWQSCVPYLRYAGRGEVLIEGLIWDKLDTHVQVILRSAGFHRGGTRNLIKP